MTALPVSSAFTDSSVTEANFKTAITNQRDFLAGLLGADGEKSTALRTLGALGNDTVAKSSNYTVIATDRGVVFVCTGTFTLSLTAAAILADGFTFAVINAGTGIVTIDPNSTEQIDGANTKDIAAGSWAIVSCTGSAFYSMGIITTYSGLKIDVIETSGNWVVPVGISSAIVYVYGGGGGGDVNANLNYAGRGGLGIANITNLAEGLSISCTIGSGGNIGGVAGGSSSFGTYITSTGGAGAPSTGTANGADGTSSYTLPSGIQLGGGIANKYPDFYSRYTKINRFFGDGTSPEAWSLSSTFAPGSPGQSSTTAGTRAAGVSGAIFIIY